MNDQERATRLLGSAGRSQRQLRTRLITFTVLFVVYGVVVYYLAASFAQAREIERGYHTLSVLSAVSGWVAIAALCFKRRSA